ncbi:hypothetical protein EJ07DRAFT_186912 [Lizonia empirigonia]|nr:hypothetical protein EJ07DRAFT_186912 [Lizonia empirigonia]
MVELIRRVIPRDLVGGNVQKLRRMDALVHIFYEVSGTAGAFCTALALIPHFGSNFSFIITPIFFAAASVLWFFIQKAGPQPENNLVLEGEPTYIIFTHRKFIWLLPGYAFALYGHRYLENAIAPAVARRYLGNSAWAQIIVGGSNFGELLGALFVFMFTNFVQTPMPWLRIDALALLIVWYLPFWHPPRGDVGQAWIVAATFFPISFGWAAGDVSLAAYIQASLSRIESDTKNVSALGAVMAFLYSTYIVTYAIASIQPAIRNVAGIQFTIIAVLVMTSTFIPKGAFALNPELLSDEALDTDLEDEDLEYIPGGHSKTKNSHESHDMSIRSPSLAADTASTISTISEISTQPPPQTARVPIARRTSSIATTDSNAAGGVTTPQADLLASKSNYELISSGQHLEMGLHFSTTMATGVMMKRATHRAAEQARRDRMKTAMVDLAEFLLDGEVTFGSGTTCFVVMRGEAEKDGRDAEGGSVFSETSGLSGLSG